MLELGDGDRSRMKCESSNWHSYHLRRKIFQTRLGLVLHFVHLYANVGQRKQEVCEASVRYGSEELHELQL